MEQSVLSRRIAPAAALDLVSTPTTTHRLLLVDGDVAYTRQIEQVLRQRGYRIARTHTASATLAYITQGDVSAVIIDPQTSGLDGFALCQAIRARSQLPVVMLSRLNDERDRVRVLDLGADDALTKPIGVEELAARLRAILRRVATHDAPSYVLEVGGLTIRMAERQILRDGREVRLTPTEFSLLVLLARHAGRTLSHTFLLQRVWGPEYRDEHEYLWAYIRRLRNKLEDDPKQPRYLLSEPGVGYRVASPAELDATRPVDEPQ